jgi:hypothetical protein
MRPSGHRRSCGAIRRGSRLRSQVSRALDLSRPRTARGTGACAAATLLGSGIARISHHFPPPHLPASQADARPWIRIASLTLRFLQLLAFTLDEHADLPWFATTVRPARELAYFPSWCVGGEGGGGREAA